MGIFFVTGRIEPSRSGKSFQVYTLTKNKKKIFIGLIARKELSRLLCKEIAFGDICKYAEKFNVKQIVHEPLSTFLVSFPKDVKPLG